VLFPGQEPSYLRLNLDETAIGHEQHYLKIGDELISENAQTISFDIPFPGRGHFRGELYKLAPPLLVRKGILYQEKGSDRSNHWVVEVPYATLTGILHLDGLVHRLNGMAYYDHQWGSVLIQEYVSDWVWGHLSNEHVAVVFFQILTQNGQLINRVAMVTKEGFFAGTALMLDYLDSLFSIKQPKEFSDLVSVSFLGQQFRVAFELSPTNLMRSRLGEVHSQTSVSYIRWSTTGTLQSGCKPQPLRGISEYIRIRPAMYGSASK